MGEGLSRFAGPPAHVVFATGRPSFPGSSHPGVSVHGGGVNPEGNGDIGPISAYNMVRVGIPQASFRVDHWENPCADAINNFIGLVTNNPPPGGAGAIAATVYFPPGTYALDKNVAFPSNIKLWLAKGANFLATVPGLTLTIRGQLDCTEDGTYNPFSFAGPALFPFAVLFAGRDIPDILPQWWGAQNGVTDDTVATQAAAACACASALAAGTGARLRFLNGSYLISDTILINAHRVHVIGAGKHATTINFNPAAARALFKFQAANPAQTINQCSAENFTLAGGGAQQKIAFDLYDYSEFEFRRVNILSSWTGNSGNAATPSIGCRTAGREFLLVDTVDWYCDRPLHITRNPNAPALSSDHTHLHNFYAAALIATESSIVVDGAADMGIANFTADGYLSLVGGQYGIRGLPGSAVSALEVAISHLRYEQPGNNLGHAIRWEVPTIGFKLESSNLGGVGAPTNGGLYLRNVNKIRLDTVDYTGQGEALNMDATCDDIEWSALFCQDNSSVSLVGLEEVLSFPKIAALAPVPAKAYYYRSASGPKSLRINGVTTDLTVVAALAVGAFVTLPMSQGAALKAAMVFCTGYSAVGPVQVAAIWSSDASGAILVAGDATKVGVGNLANKLCFFWQAIGAQTIINNTAQPLKLVIKTIYTN